MLYWAKSIQYFQLLNSKYLVCSLYWEVLLCTEVLLAAGQRAINRRQSELHTKSVFLKTHVVMHSLYLCHSSIKIAKAINKSAQLTELLGTRIWKEAKILSTVLCYRFTSKYRFISLSIVAKILFTCCWDQTLFPEVIQMVLQLILFRLRHFLNVEMHFLKALCVIFTGNRWYKKERKRRVYFS